MATTSSSNYTGLYGASASPIVPTTVYGNADVVALLAASTDGANTIGNISATGNITGVYLFGNGSQLSGLGATYSNATVSSYLASGLNSANIITTANVTGGNLTTTGVGGNITGANVITATTVSVSGNITGGNLFGNGAGITGITVVAGTQIINGTSNVSVALNGNTTIGVANVTQAEISSQGISAVGNITGSYFLGNGSQLTGITASVANSATFLTSSTNAAAFVKVDSANTQTVLPGTGRIGYGGDGIDPLTFGSVDIIPAQTNLANAYASLTFVNLANFAANPTNSVGVNSTGARFAYDIYGSPKTMSLTSAGVTTDTTISAAGNITAPYFLGNGSALTGITTTAANSATFLTASTNAAAFVSVNDSNKIVNLPGGGFISYSGDGVDPNTFGSVDIGVPQTNLANAYSALTFVNTANFLASPLNTVNVGINGPFIVYDFLGTSQTLGVSAGGVTTNTTLSAAGNITAPYFVGNGSALTGITGTYGDSNVTTLLAGFGSNTISTTGNVTSGYFVGNGSLLSNITGANVTGTVATATTAGTVTTAAQGNITSLGTLTSLSVTGNVTSGNLTGVSSSVATGIINYKDYVATITYASTITPDIALGSIQQVTLTGNVTMNAFGGTPQAGQSMVIKFIQDATGNRLLTSSMKWAGGAKTLSTAANAVDIASVFYDGTTYYASLTLAYA